MRPGIRFITASPEGSTDVRHSPFPPDRKGFRPVAGRRHLGDSARPLKRPRRPANGWQSAGSGSSTQSSGDCRRHPKTPGDCRTARSCRRHRSPASFHSELASRRSNRCELIARTAHMPAAGQRQAAQPPRRNSIVLRTRHGRSEARSVSRHASRRGRSRRATQPACGRPGTQQIGIPRIARAMPPIAAR